MNDQELREEFICVEKTEDAVKILFHEIRWQGPHTPIHTWVARKSLPATASEVEIEKAADSILEDDGYFQVCNECGDKKPLGWMLDQSICQGCAQIHHGVVY